MNNIVDTRVRNLIVLVLAVLALFLLIESIAAIAGIHRKDAMAPMNIISVSGTGEAVGTPDIATFDFTVRENNKDATAAQQAMTTKVNSAIDYLKQQGIAEKDIKTESYYTNPTYDYTNTVCNGNGICPPSQQVLTGYEVAETVSVKARDTSKAGTLLTGIANLKIGEVSSLSFTIDDMDALKLEAKKRAIEKAKAEAQQIADSLGVHLKDVTGFYEEQPPYDGYGGYEANQLGSSMSKDSVMSPQLPTGEQKVSSTVSISYEISD